MLRSPTRRWTLLIVVNVLSLCVLNLHSTTSAAPGAGEPFANSVAQRAEMIAELKEIKSLLKEQNDLLSSGKVRVQIELPQPARAKP